MPFHAPVPNPKPRTKARSAIASLVEAERMMQVALILPCSAAVGWLMGAWLDKTLHQTWISLAGIIFGGISGIVYVVRLVVGVSHRSQANSRSGRPQAKP
jgi:ATP synthase protein I